MPSEGGSVLQLRREELQAACPHRYTLTRRRQARHPAFDPMWPMALPPHVHGVPLGPLLRGKGGGVSQAIVIGLMWGRQSVCGRHGWSSWI